MYANWNLDIRNIPMRFFPLYWADDGHGCSISGIVSRSSSIAIVPLAYVITKQLVLQQQLGDRKKSKKEL